ncbi:MAG: hypothetical protein R3250_13145 [Melioribacteraceae bacterium]|nr:hypothetical protein [Melioribacteraceae bacterium]
MGSNTPLVNKQAIAISLIVAFISPLSIFLFAIIYSELGVSNSDIVAYYTFGISIAFICFLISKKHAGSFWYVALICNIPGLIISCVEPNFWTSSIWTAYLTGWILSIIGGISGERVRKRYD